MAYLSIAKQGKHAYIYGNALVRKDASKPLKRVAKCLGKIDPITKKPVFNEFYLPWLTENDLPVETTLYDYIQRNSDFDFVDLSDIHLIKTPEINDDVSSEDVNSQKGDVNFPKLNILLDISQKSGHLDLKLIGGTYFLRHISDSLGLTSVLKDVFPNTWEQILSLAMYHTIESDSLKYCQYFTDCFDDLSEAHDFKSSTIRNLLLHITEQKKALFFEKWSELFQENDYVSFDTTLISHYPILCETINHINSEEQKLKFKKDIFKNFKNRRVNGSILFGKNTGLPIYSSSFKGKINDLSGFTQSIEQYHLLKNDKIKYVLDDGMYSKKNIDYMLKNHTKFFLALPPTLNLKHELVEIFKDIYLKLKYTVKGPLSNQYGITQSIRWNNNENLMAHIFFDSPKNFRGFNKVQNKNIKLYNVALENARHTMINDEYVQYLSIRKKRNTQNDNVILNNQEVFADEILKSGWLVFLSNCITDTVEARILSMQRENVEEAFDICNDISHKSILTKSRNRRYSNKLFIGFLSLILTSQIHKTMVDEKLYKKFSMKELFLTLRSIKVIKIRDKSIFSTLTTDQKIILDIFNCPHPSNSK
ncbi:MAG: hypothetical protein LBF22_08230 [Deltaproteobacteria bacterium]|jgi:hypothetical protein|nr:hypothetical protein [Deltaproteobacteria bacterium]